MVASVNTFKTLLLSGGERLTPELTGAREPPKPSKFSMKGWLIARPVE
jgi:hypothetical protein